MSRNLKDFDVDGIAKCQRCEKRPVSDKWPGMCEECGRKYYVGIWTWVCETCDGYIDPNYPEDIERLEHAVFQLSQLGEEVSIKAIRMLRKLGISVQDLIRKYGGAA